MSVTKNALLPVVLYHLKEDRMHHNLLMKAGMLCALLSCAAAIVISVAGGLDADMLMIIDETHRMLSGQQLYIDIIQPNLPWIHFLLVPVVLVSNALGITVEYIFYPYVGLFISLGFYLSWRILASRFGASDAVKWGLIVLAAIIFFAPMRRVLIGDRMYLFVVCILPYFLMYAPAFQSIRFSPRFRAIVGAFAAVGFFFKPYNVLFWLVIQLYVIFKKKHFLAVIFSAENIAIYILFVCYLIALLVFAPGYFTQMLPLTVEVYSTYIRPLSEKIPNLLQIAAPAGFIGALCLYKVKYKNLQADDKQNIAYILLLLGTSVAYLVASSGWHYDYFPLHIACLIFQLMCLKIVLAAHGKKNYETQQKRNDARLFNGVVAASIVAIFFATQIDTLSKRVEFYLETNGRPYNIYRVAPDIDRFFYDELKEEPSVVFLSGLIGGKQISRVYGGKSVTRFSIFWPYLGYVKRMQDAKSEGEKTSLGWVREYIFRKLNEDFQNNKPDKVIIDASTKLYPEFADGDGIIPFFEHEASFKDVWKHYHRTSEINRCDEKQVVACAFVVYERIQ